jgi:2-methylcitrate dehydratase
MNFALPVVGNAGAERVMSLVDGLEQLGDVRELTQALRGSGKQNPA